MTSEQSTPVRLDLKKDEKLEIAWKDGVVCTYSLTLLRAMCPCALCKMVREQRDPHDISPQPAQPRKPLLPILPGNYAGQLTVKHAELVGNYALKIEWSDQHDTGIYSFQYLREICPPEKH
jgi:DUF971 family protein